MGESQTVLSTLSRVASPLSITSAITKTSVPYLSSEPTPLVSTSTPELPLPEREPRSTWEPRTIASSLPMPTERTPSTPSPVLASDLPDRDAWPSPSSSWSERPRNGSPMGSRRLLPSPLDPVTSTLMSAQPTTRPSSPTSRDSLPTVRRTLLSSSTDVTPSLMDATRVWLATMRRSSDPSCALSARTLLTKPSSSSTRTPGVTVLPASPPTVTSRESSRLRLKPDKSVLTSPSPSHCPCSPSPETRPPCGELPTSTVREPSTSTPLGRPSPPDGRKTVPTSTVALLTCPPSSE